jgi:hypothetical protein
VKLLCAVLIDILSFGVRTVCFVDARIQWAYYCISYNTEHAGDGCSLPYLELAAQFLGGNAEATCTRYVREDKERVLYKSYSSIGTRCTDDIIQ